MEKFIMNKSKVGCSFDHFNDWLVKPFDKLKIIFEIKHYSSSTLGDETCQNIIQDFPT